MYVNVCNGGGGGGGGGGEIPVTETAEPGYDSTGATWTRVVRRSGTEGDPGYTEEVLYRNSSGAEQTAIPSGFTLGSPPDAPIVGLEVGFAELGCTLDVDGNVTGRVLISEDASTVPATYRMVRVAIDGTITDPYTGTWQVCGGSSADDGSMAVVGCDSATGGAVILIRTIPADGSAPTHRYILSQPSGAITDPYTGVWEKCETYGLISTSEIGCAAGVSYTEIRTVSYDHITGTETGNAVIWVSDAGVVSSVRPVGFEYGACAPRIGKVGGTALICVDGETWLYASEEVYDATTGTLISGTVYFIQPDGTASTTPPPGGFTFGQCQPAIDTVNIQSGGTNIAGTASGVWAGAVQTWDGSTLPDLQSVTITAYSVTDGMPGQTANQVVVTTSSGDDVALMNGETRTWSVARDQDARLLSLAVEATGTAYATVTWSFI